MQEYENANTASGHPPMKITEVWFESMSARPVPYIFSDLLHVKAYNLDWPDILRNIYIGMFKHLMTWIKGFLQHHGNATVFDEIWAGIPSYPNF